jgi:uncharacterized protein YbbC (DUF1343 family)
MAKLQRRAVKIGLEKALTTHKEIFKNQRIGLICNQASVNKRFQHAADLFFAEDQINLKVLFGPQHGIRGDVQDNMIETAHAVDKATGLPVYSLYSETREPTAEMLENIDALVFDLQDIGGRVYTFIYTMANAMKACARSGKRFIVLDRPNPINGIDVEGNLLERGHESFVGMYPIPMRHGMTTGELAKLFNAEFSINCELEVIAMDEWSREDYMDETDAPWVMPSPNMPSVETTVVFPGTVYFEGTQVSEGRGTTRPFEIVGAPYIDSRQLTDALNSLKLSGVTFQSFDFLPTFQKNADTTCGGVFVHVLERREFRPVMTGIAMVKTIFDLYNSDFKWKNPPYEYVFDRNPFDVIAGMTKIRESIERKTPLSEIAESWKEDENSFRRLREKYLLY